MKPDRFITRLALLLLLFGLALAMSGADGVSAAEDGSEKIEPLLLERFQAEGESDFIVRFAEQADLSAAYGMEWSERGWYVVNTLTETAHRSQEHAVAYLDALGLRQRSFIAGNDIYVYRARLENASALARFPEVGYIYAPRVYAIDPGETSSPMLSATWAGELLANQLELTTGLPETVTWGIDNVNADEFWTAFNVRGEGILVANIDTGVRYTHDALDDNYACYDMPDQSKCWYDPDDIYLQPNDLNGHGTHTMGTMVGFFIVEPIVYEIGMAPNAKWIACQGCDTAGCESVDLLACGDWILHPGDNPDNRPNIVNNSWGGLDTSPWYQPVVEAWRQSGIFPAFSAGNYGSNCNTLGEPGAYQESFASAAHDENGLPYVRGSRGPSYWGHDPYTKPNISAPGVRVISSYISSDVSYIEMDGTSMASPHSAGAVALLWSCNPALIGQIDTTIQLLQNTARSTPPGNCLAPPDLEGNYTYGYGYLDVLEAGYAACGGALTGVLNGHVYDVQGNPLSGATVSAEVSPGSRLLGTTDSTGAYSIRLPVGSYAVTAELNGYLSQTVNGVVITLGETTFVDFNLPFLGLWTLDEDIQCFDLNRFDAEYFPATGKIYVMGGRYDTSGVSTTPGYIYVVDPVAHTCDNTGVVMHTPVSNYTISLVNNGETDLLCTFGGRTATGIQTRAVQCYNPLDGTVEHVTDLPEAFEGYTPGAQVVYNNRVYIFGGINPSTGVESALTFRYNPQSSLFDPLGNLSQARGYIMAAVVDGRIYAFGGDILEYPNLIPQTTAEVMADPEGAGTWDDAAVADLPFPAGDGRAFGFDSGAPWQLAGQVVLATMAQWPNSSWEVITYNVHGNHYELNYPNLNISRRNHAGVIAPLVIANLDGPLVMWVFGGFCASSEITCAGDYYPYGPAEFIQVDNVERDYIPMLVK